MRVRTKVTVIVLAVSAILAFAGCGASQSASSASSGSAASAGSSEPAQSAPASASASASASTASSSASSASSASSQAAALDGQGAVTIDLDYNAGTGYEWVAAVEPEGVIGEVGKTTTDESGRRDVAGGPLQDHFTYRALAPGEAVITFTLERSWEPGDAAETQVYAFTVTDDLNMVLNPYKSDFENEPSWGGN